MRFCQILALKLALLLNVSACAESYVIPMQVQAIVQERLGSYVVSLQEKAKKCQLNVGGRQLELQIPWPCDFHRNQKNEVRIKSLKNTKIVLIEAASRHSTLTGSCDTRIQAVKFSKQKVIVSEYVNEVATCPPFQWDDKIFTGLFK